jgi:hypothetical protein
MREIETITWRELTGNKFLRGIDSGMLSESGYVKQSATRKVGDREKTIFNVVYDREYLIRSLGKVICRPLFILGKQKTLELVAEAWDTCYPYSASKSLQPVEVADDNYAKV